MDGCASLLREWGFYAIIVMTFGNGNFLRVHNDVARSEVVAFRTSELYHDDAEKASEI